MSTPIMKKKGKPEAEKEAAPPEPPPAPPVMPRCPDQYLRRWGFQIHSRPKGKPVRWQDKKTHQIVDEADAYARALLRQSKAQQEKRDKAAEDVIP